MTTTRSKSRRDEDTTEANTEAAFTTDEIEKSPINGTVESIRRRSTCAPSPTFDDVPAYAYVCILPKIHITI